MSGIQDSMNIKVSSELLNTTKLYEIVETFKFKNYLTIQPSLQSNLQVAGPILFNSFYQEGYFLPSESYISITGRLINLMEPRTIMKR